MYKLGKTSRAAKISSPVNGEEAMWGRAVMACPGLTVIARRARYSLGARPEALLVFIGDGKGIYGLIAGPER